MTIFNRWISAIVMVALLAPAGQGALAQDKEPSGSFKFQATNVGIGVRIEWGEGVLTLKDGSTHSFSVEGLKLVGVGYSKVSAHGDVFKLEDLDKFNGTYSMAGAGGALVKGKSIAVMANEAGVTIELEADQSGVQLSAGGGGLTFKLKE